jgi:adenylate cyclase, class 2
MKPSASAAWASRTSSRTKVPGSTRRPRPASEIELPLAAGAAAAEQFAELLTALGFRRVAEVRKLRRKACFHREGFEVEAALDEVESLGHFAELELIADDANLDAARQCLASLAAELGLTSTERRSYLELLLERVV